MIESQRSQSLRMSLMTGEGASFPFFPHACVRSECMLPQWMQQYFIFAAVQLPSDSTIIISLAAQISAGACLVARYGLAGSLFAIIPGLAGLIYLLRLAHNRAESFERDYATFLLSLSSSIRTGLDPLVAFSRSGALFPAASVIGIEIKKSVNEIEAGTDEEQVFLGFARSVNHPDIGLLRTALVLSRRQGSSLGTCLQRLAKVTRQRQSFRRKMRGAVAMQRLSAFGIAGCTVIVGVIQFTSNPQALQQAWNHPLGRVALCGGLGLVGVGLLWMLHMSRRRQ